MESIINGEISTEIMEEDKDKVVKSKKANDSNHEVHCDISKSSFTDKESDVHKTSNPQSLEKQNSIMPLNDSTAIGNDSLVDDITETKTVNEENSKSPLSLAVPQEEQTSDIKENGMLKSPDTLPFEDCDKLQTLRSNNSEKLESIAEHSEKSSLNSDMVDKTIDKDSKSLKRKLSDLDSPKAKIPALDESTTKTLTDLTRCTISPKERKSESCKSNDSTKENDDIVSTDSEFSESRKNFMSGGSIVTKSEVKPDEESNASKESLETSDEDKTTNTRATEADVTKKELPKEDSSMSVDNEQSSDLSRDQTANKNNIKSTPDGTNSLIDLSSTKLSLEDSLKKVSPLEKLDKHVKSLESDKELKSRLNSHKQKNDVSLLNLTSPPAVSNSHTCDKENKCADKESSDSFVFADLTNEETGFPDVFTGLVTIGKYISVKGDFTLRSSEALVESPSLVAPYLLKEPDSFPPKDKDSKSEEKIKDFFHSAAGEILVGIGLSRVTEWFHRDMVRIKKRQMKKNGKSPELEEELAKHENFFNESSKANNIYTFDLKSCKTCGFTTESAVVFEGHLLVPHITPRREYQCNYCEVFSRDPKGMLVHMLQVHQKTGRIQPPVLLFECPFCTFESNSKIKLSNHLIKCQRLFDIGINQAPPRDFEFPALTPKPITVAVVKAYEKSLGSMQRGRGRPKKDPSDPMHPYSRMSPLNSDQMASGFRSNSNLPLVDSLSMQNQMMSPLQMPNMNIRPGQLHAGMSPMHMHPPHNRFFQVVNPAGQIMPLMGNNHLASSASQFPFSPNLNNSAGKKTSTTTPYFNSMYDSNLHQHPPPNKGSPNVTVSPLPKLTGPYPVPPMSKSSPSLGTSPMHSNSLVVCEICDGYIKDLEQLRTHMQLIHKVKIHPKMLVSRPPLNCQKCQWRFFTDQGLERHLLGSHGLVTSNMQELSNKGKDAGCCTVCGRVYATKLVSHMNQVHKITLKPAHLSYKCTVCSATFNLYRLFENHVYLVHSGAAKRAADGRSSPLSKKLKVGNGEGEKQVAMEESDENIKNCKECGVDMTNEKSQTDKCGKCLDSNSNQPVKSNKT